MVEIIGIRKRNGVVEQNFTPMSEHIEPEDIEGFRKRYTVGDVTGVDLGIKERCSESEFNATLKIFGLELEYLKKRKEQYERKRGNTPG